MAAFRSHQPVSFAMLEAPRLISHPVEFTYANELFSLNFPDVLEGSDRLSLRRFVNRISQIPASVVA